MSLRSPKQKPPNNDDADISAESIINLNGLRAITDPQGELNRFIQTIKNGTENSCFVSYDTGKDHITKEKNRYVSIVTITNPYPPHNDTQMGIKTICFSSSVCGSRQDAVIAVSTKALKHKTQILNAFQKNTCGMHKKQKQNGLSKSSPNIPRLISFNKTIPTRLIESMDNGTNSNITSSSSNSEDEMISTSLSDCSLCYTDESGTTTNDDDVSINHLPDSSDPSPRSKQSVMQLPPLLLHIHDPVENFKEYESYLETLSNKTLHEIAQVNYQTCENANIESHYLAAGSLLNEAIKSGNKAMQLKQDTTSSETSSDDQYLITGKLFAQAVRFIVAANTAEEARTPRCISPFVEAAMNDLT